MVDLTKIHRLSRIYHLDRDFGIADVEIKSEIARFLLILLP
jgi:hypothetical protein